VTQRTASSPCGWASVDKRSAVMNVTPKDMSDLYDKIREDVPFRKMWAEKSGFGFELPSVVPNVPKKEDQSEAAKAA